MCHVGSFDPLFGIFRTPPLISPGRIKLETSNLPHRWTAVSTNEKCKIGLKGSRGGHEIVIIRVDFLHPRYFFITCAHVDIAPFDRFSCFIAQKTCFGDSYVFFGVRPKKLIISTIFRKKAKFHIPSM